MTPVPAQSYNRINTTVSKETSVKQILTYYAGSAIKSASWPQTIECAIISYSVQQSDTLISFNLWQPYLSSGIWVDVVVLSTWLVVNE